MALPLSCFNHADDHDDIRLWRLINNLAAHSDFIVNFQTSTNETRKKRVPKSRKNNSNRLVGGSRGTRVVQRLYYTTHETAHCSEVKCLFFFFLQVTNTRVYFSKAGREPFTFNFRLYKLVPRKYRGHFISSALALETITVFAALNVRGAQWTPRRKVPCQLNRRMLPLNA